MFKIIFTIILTLVLAGCAGTSMPLETSSSRPVIAPSLKPDFDKTPYLNDSISVSIQGGQVNFNDINGYAAYKPVTATLKPNESTTITLTKSGDNFFNSKAQLELIYKGGMLYIDGEENASALMLGMTDLWVPGEKYELVNTHGVASLRGADIMVKLV